MKIQLIGAILCALIIVACGASINSSTPVKVNSPGGSYLNITPALLKQMLAAKDFVFINVHIPYEGELAQTDAFIPYDKIQENIGKFPATKDAKIVLYCRSGNMSSIAAEDLVKRGYMNVWNLDGGWTAWERAGLPLIRK